MFWPFIAADTAISLAFIKLGGLLVWVAVLTIGQRGGRFIQAVRCAEYDHVTDASAHALDIFAQIQRLGNQRVGWV